MSSRPPDEPLPAFAVYGLKIDYMIVSHDENLGGLLLVDQLPSESELVIRRTP